MVVAGAATFAGSSYSVAMPVVAVAVAQAAVAVATLIAPAATDVTD